MIKFKHVAHLYINSTVQFKSKEDAERTYGNIEEATITGIYQNTAGAGLTAQLCVDDREEPIEPLVDEVTPELYPLSTMTEEQALRMGIWSNWHDAKFFAQGFGDVCFAPSTIIILLQNNFDLFELIKNGEAIDKTKK